MANWQNLFQDRIQNTVSYLANLNQFLLFSQIPIGIRGVSLVLRIRIYLFPPDPDFFVKSGSVADPECLSRILIFTHPGSRISDPGSKNSNKREG
jgi:hypothetical protein